MTFANNLDPDEGLHLRSKLFDIQKKMNGNYEFFENFERNKYLKKLPSMQRVKVSPVYKNAIYLSFEWHLLVLCRFFTVVLNFSSPFLHEIQLKT